MLRLPEGLLRPAQCPGGGRETPRVTELQPEVISDHPAWRAGSSAAGKGQAIPSAQSHLHSPWTAHETAFALSPQMAPQAASHSSAGALELRFSDFMEWENTEIQEFHRVRKTWPGKVTFPSSKHHPAPLGLRSDTWQRFLLPAGLECGHVDTYPAQI